MKQKRTIITYLPAGLIYSRLVLGIVIVVFAVFQPEYLKTLLITAMIWAIISDVFDGIIARMLGISTEKLRRLDSSIDQIFWVCAIVGSFVLCADFYREHYMKISIILLLEVVSYAISFLRFRKEVATHAILSKFWAVTVLAVLIEIALRCDSSFLFDICFYAGVFTRLEIIAILLLIKEWANDVPSVYHAILLRKGKPIKRHKLFNG